ncbi:phosphodiester glycosidase family protein|uniref:AMIN domain-containing protein n=1 Tax=Dendrosporobacter quercicolus TaxID=146817 RepID=A0A1G9R3I2_9FIRM|nr:phosphodiester glycosidase family protein [Dendrosporobacter quercicolus]NSL48465.1 phosphodiester glycosidase family protein [Dendrosporobacter quercicolus DSM 1736]SDM17778.1 AMIN domain-containing protein [Dendrosporobacter quercicolus]
MKKILLALFVTFLIAVSATEAAPAALVKQVRYSQTAQTVRLVFDLDQLPDYKISLTENPAALVIEFAGKVDQAVLPAMTFSDPAVKRLTFGGTSPDGLKIAVELNRAVLYKAFTLTGPNRLVVDVMKEYEQKVQEEVAPGVKLTTLLRGRPEGPIAAYLLEIEPKSGWVIQPVLSNDAIVNLETVKSMADRTKAVAAVNASYFSLHGELLGLTKINHTIVSTGDLARTALGIMPDGQAIIGPVEYEGTVVLPDGANFPVAGINQRRGQDSLVVYNSYYGPATDTNQYGAEYVVKQDKVVSIHVNNTPLEPDGIVLSAHGAAADQLAKLQVGDTVRVFQTLGPVWDKTLHVVGAGPALVKNNSVYLSTKIEKFGADVAGGRAPRTAVGITEDGHILLAVVDGRQYGSMGFSLLELALFMQEAGAVQAMNLDGGGSSEMVVNGKIVNKPSDRRERRVGSALTVMPESPIKLAN